MAYDFDPDKFLQIAAELMKPKSEGWTVTKITSRLKVGGRDVGKVGRLIKAGLIEINPDGDVEYAASLEDIDEFLEDLDTKKLRKKGRKTIAVSAESGFEEVYKQEIVEEAKHKTSQYFVIGKAVAQASWRYFQAKGIPIEEAVNYPIEAIIPEALEFLARGEQLERQNKMLREQQRVLAMEVDPVMRLKTATGFLLRFMEFAVLGKMMGLDLANSQAVQYYETLINGILTGDLQSVTQPRRRRT